MWELETDKIPKQLNKSFMKNYEIWHYKHVETRNRQNSKALK